MIEQYLRPAYQKYFAEVLARIIFNRMSPLTITYGALCSGLGCGFFIAINQTELALAMLITSGFLDTMDGTVARLKNQTSDAGATIDILFDRIVEFAIVLGLFLYDPSRALIAILMMGAILICVTSFLMVGMFSANDSHKSFHYSRGLMERPEAFVFFGLMIMIPQLFYVLGLLFTGLVFLTSLIRVRQFMEHTKRYGI